VHGSSQHNWYRFAPYIIYNFCMDTSSSVSYYLQCCMYVINKNNIIKRIFWYLAPHKCKVEALDVCICRTLSCVLRHMSAGNFSSMEGAFQNNHVVSSIYCYRCIVMQNRALNNESNMYILHILFLFIFFACLIQHFHDLFIYFLGLIYSRMIYVFQC